MTINDAISETMFTELCRVRLLLKSGLQKDNEAAAAILERWSPYLEDPKLMVEDGWNSK